MSYATLPLPVIDAAVRLVVAREPRERTGYEPDAAAARLEAVAERQRIVAFYLHASAGFHLELADHLRERPRTLKELVVLLYGDDLRPARRSLELLLYYMQRMKFARQLPDGRWEKGSDL